MGLFSFLFGKPDLDDAARLQDALGAKTVGRDVHARINHAARLLTSRKFDEAIDAYTQIAQDFPEERGTCLSQVGAAWYFKGEFARAIEAYVIARDAGADADMMDDNLWEACEALAKKEPAQKAAHLAAYLRHCPNGKHRRAAGG